jgi:cation:H+ antiporter
VLGVVAIVGKNIELKDYTHFKSNRLFQMGAVLAPLILMLDGTLTRIDGGILILLFVWNLFRLFDIDDKILGRKVLRPHLAKYAHDRVTTWRQFMKHLFLLILGASLLLGATLFLVRAVEDISHVINVSGALIGVLVIAVSTSLPDLVVGLRSVVKHKGGMALGDVFGAATMNSTLTLGIVAIISPFSIGDLSIVWIAMCFTIIALLLIFYFLKSKHSISRKEGSILFGVYILFVVTQVGMYIF